MSIISLTVAGLAAMFMAQAGPAPQPALAGVQVCLQQQVACSTGQCNGAEVELACNFSALDPQAAAVVRAELRGFARMVENTPSAAVCAETIAARVLRAANSIETDGPLPLVEPYAYTPDTGELSTDIEAELFWRAQLEERASGFARELHMDRQGGPTDACDLPPLVDVVQLRAQNLAFAESVGALDLARAGELSPPAMWGVWFIYNHADLWQAEQAEAAEVFTRLAADNAFSDPLARGLVQRVANHQPLYSESDLAGGWPE